MGVIEGLIGAAGGLVQSFIEGSQQRRNIDQQNKANMRLAEYQYSKDLDMWNRQNEYNSPKSQMERFNAAGLNPNLIYGQGSPGNATVLPKYNAPELSYNYKPGVNISDALQMYQDFMVRNAQIDNLKAQKKVLEAEATVRGVKAEFAGDLADIGYQKAFNESQISKYKRIFDEQTFMQLFYKEGNMWYPKDIGRLRNIAEVKWELGKTQADMRGQLLDNELKQKTLNWYIADKLGKIAAGAIGAVGVGRLGKIARRRR